MFAIITHFTLYYITIHYFMAKDNHRTNAMQLGGKEHDSMILNMKCKSE